MGYSDEDLIGLLRQLTDDEKKYHAFCEIQGILDKIEGLITSGALPRERLIICTQRVQTVVNRRGQEKIVRTYYVGKTNHRG